jgi:hypothetical protein
MAVHHVDVQNVSAAAFDRAYFLAETREVGGQNRRGNFDISVVEHAPDPQPNCATGFIYSGLGRPALAEELPVVDSRLRCCWFVNSYFSDRYGLHSLVE